MEARLRRIGVGRRKENQEKEAAFWGGNYSIGRGGGKKWRQEGASVAEGKAGLEQDAQERFSGGSASKKKIPKAKKKGWGGVKVAGERGGESAGNDKE